MAGKISWPENTRQCRGRKPVCRCYRVNTAIEKEQIMRIGADGFYGTVGANRLASDCGEAAKATRRGGDGARGGRTGRGDWHTVLLGSTTRVAQRCSCRNRGRGA